MGWLYDHAQIGDATRVVIDQLDHRTLNEIDGLENPTFENLSIWIWNKLARSARTVRGVVHETASVRCSYCGS